ncbi:MAG: hypothetical protein Q8P32_05185 [Candidatus Komeilibacteria bacterium]|nr:hypothetical protein [Candidatus Komeilibacteria bacterium]
MSRKSKAILATSILTVAVVITFIYNRPENKLYRNLVDAYESYQFYTQQDGIYQAQASALARSGGYNSSMRDESDVMDVHQNGSEYYRLHHEATRNRSEAFSAASTYNGLIASYKPGFFHRKLPAKL